METTKMKGKDKCLTNKKHVLGVVHDFPYKQNFP